jgi:hypothetical protein
MTLFKDCSSRSFLPVMEKPTLLEKARFFSIYKASGSINTRNRSTAVHGRAKAHHRPPKIIAT